MIIHHTHCSLRLGDNLAHLQLLRALAKAYPTHHFRHTAHVGYLPQMVEVVADLPNITLGSLESKARESFEVWKNDGGFWENHPLKNEYARFYIEFFRGLSDRMGLLCPIRTADDLLFDYPALQQQMSGSFDFLVVNSTPMSNQAQGYQRHDMIKLIADLSAKYSVICTQRVPLPNVNCTQDHNLTVTGIGALSRLCKYIVMVSTGPSWPTFNVWTNQTCKLRVIIIDHERIGIGQNSVQAKTVAEARNVLMAKGLI